MEQERIKQEIMVKELMEGGRIIQERIDQELME